MDCVLYFGEAITDFFGLAIYGGRRVCVFLSFWHFNNINDLNDKAHTVRKAWCWGNNTSFWIGLRRYVCICIICVYVCIYMYIHVCMSIKRRKYHGVRGVIDIRQSSKWLLASMFPFGYPFLPSAITFLVIFIYLWKWMCVVSLINVIRYSLWLGSCWTTWGTP